jgi:alpha-beta hydrolase superfamily lysophospholipase
MIAGVRRRARIVKPVLPQQIGEQDGLAYSLWLPDGAVRGGVVILHGAGSCKENHHDFARAAIATGLAAVAFDQRGHGASRGPMDGRVIDDVAAIAQLLRARLDDPELPLALRGSSMGGYLAIVAAPAVRARAVVSICPASAEGLRRGLGSGSLRFDADLDALDRFLSAHELYSAVETLAVPLLLLHAEGDEQVPVEHSRELAERAAHPQSRLIAVPGGHHRSVQHDAELQAISLRWIERALASAVDQGG